MDDVTIRARTADGAWTVLGVDRETGIVPESITMTADEAGPATLGFTIRRDPRVAWDDLQAGNQIEVESRGSVVWGGRINQTPGAGRDSTGTITVSAQGWRAHLDDDQIDKGWVRDRLEGLRDSRSFLTVPANNRPKDAASVSTDGSPRLGFAENSPATPGDSSSVSVDLGQNRTWVRAVVTTLADTVTVDTTLYVMGTQEEGWSHASRIDAISAQVLTSGTEQTYTGLLTSPRRHAHILFFYGGAGGSWSNIPVGFRLKSVKLFANDRDAAGFASALIASNVVKDVLASGALPLLSSDSGLIDQTAFVIPEFWPDGYRTPREILGAVNAYHDYRLGVTADRRLFFRSRPTEPLYMAGSWSGDALSDASLGNLDALYNRVIVEYTGPDGAPSSVVRTATSSLLNRQGLTRTTRLPIQATLTAAAATQIGDVWLAKHSTAAPLSGSITVAPGDVRSTQTGLEVHPSALLAATGERITLTDRADNETGAVGRVGTIVGVTYNPASEAATVQLDNDTSSLESWLSRLAVIQGAG